MQKKDWEQIKYFNEKENWGDPTRMSLAFLLTLDTYRDYVGAPFIVHCAYKRQGHTPNSQHYLTPCRAVDGHFKDYKVSPLEAYIKAEQVGFTGIGLYPNNGQWFIHLDLRPLNGFRKRWIRDDEGVYHPLNAQNYRKMIHPLELNYGG